MSHNNLSSYDRERLIKKVLELWEQHPNLRFGQLIKNIVIIEDLFYISDKKFDDLLNETIQRFKQR